MESRKKSSGAAVVLAVTLGTFMSSFDVSVVNMALPIIQSGFHCGIAAIEWVVVAYLLVLGATQLTFGRLSDMIGHKKVYISGFMLFTLSSLACGLSSSLAMLIAFRVVQAIGAAMLQSSASPIIIDAVEPANRGKSLGMMAVAVGVSTCLGPVLGGFLASCFGWSSIFFVNVPVGIIGTILAFKLIRNDGKDKKKESDARFDPAGSAPIIIALFFIMLPLNLISRLSVGLPIVFASLAIGIIALVLFIIVEKKSAYPIINLSLFKNKVFTASNFAAMFFYMAEFILVFLSPYYFQKMRMMTATMSGIMLLPMSLTMIAGAPISGTIADRLGTRSISCIGLAVMSVGTLMFGLCGIKTPIVLLIISLCLFGFGGGFFQTPNTTAVMGSAPSNRRGIASATLGTMRNIGMGIGEAVSAALISLCMNTAAPALASKGLTGAALYKGELLSASHLTCFAAVICCVAALILSLIRGETKPAPAVTPAVGKSL